MFGGAVRNQKAVWALMVYCHPGSLASSVFAPRFSSRIQHEYHLHNLVKRLLDRTFGTRKSFSLVHADQLFPRVTSALSGEILQLYVVG